MKTHVERGVLIISSISSLDNDVISAVLHHHENFDGSGYPKGLSGQTIPIMARIICVADAVDAMLTDRPYRKRLSVTETTTRLRSASGTQFDPNVVSITINKAIVQMHSRRIDLRLPDLSLQSQDRSPGIRVEGTL